MNVRSVVIGSFLVLAGVANAAVVTSRFDGASPLGTVNVSADSGANFGDVTAGLLNWTRTGGDYAGLQGTYAVFCIELAEHIGPGNEYTHEVTAIENGPTALGGMGLARALELRELYGRVYAGLDLGDTDQVVAFQLSVWEIVHDGNLSLSTGQFQATNSGAAWGVAQAWLSAIDGTGPMVNLEAAINYGAQDYVVPAPGAIALAGVGGVLVLRRKR